MLTYCNEFDEFAAKWLYALGKEGHISASEIDTSSILEIPNDEAKIDRLRLYYERAHFFAGIGGWDYALRLAGWPEGEAVWTGSCPCQPFSVAGRGKGTADERHLWPVWFRIIEQCRPPVIFGEQVASDAGRAWFAGVRADLEGLGYAVGAADLCAAGLGAPHIRQRLFWMAHTRHFQRGRWSALRAAAQGHDGAPGQDGGRGEGWDDEGRQRPIGDPSDDGSGSAPGSGRGDGGLGDTGGQGLPASEPETVRGEGRGIEGGAVEQPGPALGPWSRSVAILCADGKARRVEPSIFPLVDGVPGRVGRLRGYGNAIVPQEAAVFVRACMEYLSTL